MRTIKTMKQFYKAIDDCKEIVCLFFVLTKSQPCKAIEPILVEECNKENIKILKIVVDNDKIFNLINKYNVGLLPKYVFIKDGKIVNSSYGFTTRIDIKEEIKKSEEYECL